MRGQAYLVDGRCPLGGRLVDYDLNEVAEALAAVFNGVDAWVIDGQMVEVLATSEAGGVANVPAAVLELDDIAWDVSMGNGADMATFLLYVIVGQADSSSGQRLVRQLLSRGGTATSLKEALVDNQTLSGLVSYAHMPGPRTIGTINYAGVAYQGATLEIEVMLQ